MSCVWVRVDGYDGYSIGDHFAPTWEWLADGGCGLASVQFDTSELVPHHALRKYATFEVMYGLHPVYSGAVTEFDRQTGELHAKGLGLWLYDFLALDPVGATTRTIEVAIARARIRGWPGSDLLNVSGTASGEADGNPISVGALFDEFCEQTGQRWGTDEWGRVWVRSLTQTVPNWIVAPDAAVFGETTEDAPTALAGRYESTTGENQTAFAGTTGLGKEQAVDLTKRGALTNEQAVEILAGSMERRSGRSWVNGAELTSDQITTIGGNPAFLPSVRAGHLMRTFGAGYVDGGLVLDTFIGKTTYTAGAPTIRLEPWNKVPRTATEVWAA